MQLVVTHPDLRRRGYARAVVAALLYQLTAEDTTLFEMHPSPQASLWLPGILPWTSGARHRSTPPLRAGAAPSLWARPESRH
ncbi:GNAT family N-acetyltransferase [Streptomyces sp. NPDC051956]|uniref:GNAT family N-acetyltransferase n=1 Tax=Streptomyces sp. NPDC051956 TaxID=3365677 RepID=UPI0037D09D02